MEPIMSKKDFFKRNTPQPVRNAVQTGAVCGYISAALTLILALVFSPLLIIDFVLMLGLTLGVHIAKSRVCAVIIVVYFILSKITMGNLNAVGIAFTAAYAWAAYGTFCFQKLWKAYQQNPVEEVQPFAAGAASVQPPLQQVAQQPNEATVQTLPTQEEDTTQV